MSFLRNLSPRPKCIVCGELVATGSNRCPRHHDSDATLQSQTPSNPNPDPGTASQPGCVECGDPAVPGSLRCQRHQISARPSPDQRQRPPDRQGPGSISGQAERVKISFGDAILLGAGFMLGAFLISIPIFVVFVVMLPSIIEIVFEVFREANRP